MKELIEIRYPTLDAGEWWPIPKGSTHIKFRSADQHLFYENQIMVTFVKETDSPDSHLNEKR